jgi:predicted NBD/HSP70 family sugar kinase
MTEQVGAEDDVDGIPDGRGPATHPTDAPLVTGPPNFHTTAQRAAARRQRSAPAGRRRASSANGRGAAGPDLAPAAGNGNGSGSGEGEGDTTGHGGLTEFVASTVGAWLAGIAPRAVELAGAADGSGWPWPAFVGPEAGDRLESSALVSDPRSEDEAVIGQAAERPVPPFVAGVDVGGTKTLAVVIDGRGESVAQVRLATDASGSRGLIATVREALVEVAEGVGLAPDGLAAVGIGVPGLVDPRNEGLRHAVNLDIGDVPVSLHDPVSRLIGGPVTVGNDVNLAALGAAELFGREGIVAYLSVGTGLAAGFVIDGEVFAGAHGVAGEIGHLPVDPYGAICECGQTGCLETVASGAAIARRWTNPTGGPSDAGSLLAAASAGDREAMAVRDEVCGYLAWAVALIAQTVDPEVVVLGGGVAEAGAPLLDAVRAALTRRAAASPFIASLGLAERVTIVPPGVSLGAVGAARAARDLLAIESDDDDVPRN